jgi:hypothetical protein
MVLGVVLIDAYAGSGSGPHSLHQVSGQHAPPETDEKEIVLVLPVALECMPAL